MGETSIYAAATVLPAMSDSDFMICLIDRSLVY